jgi:hypothetical protein
VYGPVVCIEEQIFPNEPSIFLYVWGLFEDLCLFKAISSLFKHLNLNTWLLIILNFERDLSHGNSKRCQTC